jgi:hypothetical protein
VAGDSMPSLVIEVLRASSLPDTSTFVNTQDPYAKITCGDAEPVSTSPVSEGGTEATWTKEHGNVVTVEANAGGELLFEVWNANTFQDELIGQILYMSSQSKNVSW